MPKARGVIDATPGAHSFLDAQATVSFRLACGCYIGHGQPSDAIMLKGVGTTYPCVNHGDQVITKANQRLVGWNRPRRRN